MKWEMLGVDLYIFTYPFILSFMLAIFSIGVEIWTQKSIVFGALLQ